MTNRKLLLVGAHRIAILLFVLFALFPIFWLVKVSVTPMICFTAKACGSGHRA